MPYSAQNPPGLGIKLASVLTGGIAGAVAGIPQYRREQELSMQAAMEAEKEKRRREQELIDEAGSVGLSPSRNPDGTINLIATKTAALRAKQALDSAREAERMRTAQKIELEGKARAVGIDPMAAAAPTNAPGWSVMAKEPAKVPAKPLEQQVAHGEAAQAAARAAAIARASGEAGAPYEQNYVQGDNYALNGRPLGRAVRNTRTGEMGFMVNGKMEPIPEGAEPTTATAVNKNLVGLLDFKKLKNDLTDSERSLRQLERYAGSVGGLQQGLAGLADRFTAGIKTIFGQPLNKQELDRRLANGNLQGLLGGNRLAVVGGGVMTEQDAQRIIDYLGGDVNAWQNKEQVMQAMSQLYQDRFAQYENDINFYNSAVDEQYGSKGFKRSEYTDYNPLFGTAANGGSAAAPSAPAAGGVAPSGLTPQEEARRQELRQKLGIQ